jgi:hypothetical protein
VVLKGMCAGSRGCVVAQVKVWWLKGMCDRKVCRNECRGWCLGTSQNLP